MAGTPQEASTSTILTGLRGLHNLGNTCFMNSVLQILLRCPPVIKLFLADHHNRFQCHHLRSSEQEDTFQKRTCLACEMDLLFTQCYSGQQPPFSPISFLQAMWNASDIFAGYEQQDAHEFLIAVLAAINSGLAQLCSRRSSICSPVGAASPNPAFAFPSARNVRRKVEPGYDLKFDFTGVLRSDVTCLKCRTKSTKFDDFTDVSLDLTKDGAIGGIAANGGGSGSDGGGGSGNGNSNHSYYESLEACLRSFTRAEQLTSRERCWCSSCGELQDCAKQLSVHKLPNVLCIHLKRFEHSASLPSASSSHSKQTPSTSSKIEAFVEFPLRSLNMRPHTSSHVCSGGADSSAVVEPLPEQLYDLFGVVVHHGGMQNGHYTSFVRSQADWFLCDDALIAPTTEAEVRACKGYLLFYIAKRLR